MALNLGLSSCVLHCRLTHQAVQMIFVAVSWGNEQQRWEQLCTWLSSVSFIHSAVIP